MGYTNSGLVKHCKEALKLKTVYMWGGLFREVTKGYIDQLSGIKGYQVQYPADRKAYLNSLVGKGYYGCDCVGLVKSYYFGGVGTAKNAKGYKGSLDYGVGSMYNAAKVKGKIADMPKKEGVLVMTSDFGHVGVYVGNNEVIECTLSKFGDGVVKTKFSDRNWAWWCQCPVIEDDTGVTKSAINSNPVNVNTATVTVTDCNNIYISEGVAALRSSASTSGTLKGRCNRKDYYVGCQIVKSAENNQTWFKHANSGLYSALNDTNGTQLFSFYSSYTQAITNAPVKIRAESGLNGTEVGKLTKGVPVYMTGKTTKSDGLTWCQIVYGGKLCWCDGQWIG